jgi:hypothetical protein
MAKAADPLNQLVERIRKESPLPIFPFLGTLPEDNRVRWDGEDVGEFLTFAKKIGATVLYLSSDTVSEEDNEEHEGESHAGEVAIVVAAFLHEGVFHEFVEVADWARPEVDEEEGLELDPRTTSGAENLLRAHEDEWTGEFLAELAKRPEPVEFGRFTLDTQLRRFLAPKLSTDRHVWSPMGISHDGSGLDQLIQKIADAASARLFEEERKKVEPMVAECVAWATKLGIRSLSKSDVDAFLLERGQGLSGEGRKLLWTQAKLAVKVGGKRAGQSLDESAG